MEFGLIPETTGMGLRSVTALEPMSEVLAMLTASTETELGLGRIAGAV
jgi:hypothetical protein